MSGRQQESMLTTVLLALSGLDNWPVTSPTLNVGVVADAAVRICMCAMYYEKERGRRIGVIEDNKKENGGCHTPEELAELGMGCQSISQFAGIASALCLYQYVVSDVLVLPYEQLYPNLGNVFFVLPFGARELLTTKLPHDGRINELLLLEAVHNYDEALDFAAKHEPSKAGREALQAAVQLQKERAFSDTVSTLLKDDRKTVLAAVRQCGMVLYYAPDEFKDDHEMVLAAVQQNGTALYFASNALKGDSEIVLAAVQQNGAALNFAATQLQGNYKIVLAALQQNGMALAFVATRLQGNRKIVLAAVRQNSMALHFAPIALRTDREVKRLRLAAVQETFVPQTDTQWGKACGQACLEDAKGFTEKVVFGTAGMDYSGMLLAKVCGWVCLEDAKGFLEDGKGFPRKVIVVTADMFGRTFSSKMAPSGTDETLQLNSDSATRLFKKWSTKLKKSEEKK